ncbi:MAG: nitroreductase family protein, partial [Candidatus Hodarchaeales archaeon]
LQNFLLQSSALNLDTWVITQFDSEQIKQSLNITLEPLIILPVGQLDDLNHVLLRIKKQNSRIEESPQEMTVEQAIASRKSIRDYIGGKIPLAVLMNILQDSITINYLEGDNSLLDLRVVAGEIDGLSTGMYKFSMDNYALNQYSQGDSRNSLKTVALDQPWVENAQLDLVLSANTTWIDQQSDPIFHQRKMMFNIGMIAQNIYLKCTSHGLGTVVVGAFNDWGVAKLIATPDTHLPFYIIPIGLTPEFGDHPMIINLPMIEIARSIGLLSFILFYFSLYMTLPVLRRRNRKLTRWLHFISGSIFITGIGYHYMTIHGYVKSFGAFLNLYVYFNALLIFIGDIFAFPTTYFELGKFAINYGLIFGSIAAVSGIIMFFKRVKYQKLLRSLHKHTLFLVLLLAIVHNFFNGTYFAGQSFFFLYLNILIFTFYFLIDYSFDLIRISRRQAKQLQ